MGGLKHRGPGRQEQFGVWTVIPEEPRELLHRGLSLASHVGCVSRAPTGSVQVTTDYGDCPRGALGWGSG